MNIDDREMANVLERFFVKHLKYLEDEGKIMLPKKKTDREDYLMELVPTDMDYRDYAKEIIKDINKLKGKWVV